jgi:tripartite-type tricarboxylate transporter receptor subunit TctC
MPKEAVVYSTVREVRSRPWAATTVPPSVRAGAARAAAARAARRGPETPDLPGVSRLDEQVTPT